jgi:hypothetical protein
VLASAIALAGCAKKAGSSCKGGESICVDKTTALACRGTAFVEVPCGGPAGCAKYGNHAACDTSIATAGAPCMGEDDEYACSADRQHAFVCKSGRLERWLECRGKNGCAVDGHALACDMSIASRGDPCRNAGAIACGEDGKHTVACRDGKFDVQRQCRGSGGCAYERDLLTCDDSISLPGDPCTVAGKVVCTVDGTSELMCQQGIFTKALTCKNGCKVLNRPGRPIECK